MTPEEHYAIAEELLQRAGDLEDKVSDDPERHGFRVHLNLVGRAHVHAQLATGARVVYYDLPELRLEIAAMRDKSIQPVPFPTDREEVCRQEGAIKAFDEVLALLPTRVR
jgi:hypothetical protein